MPKFTKKFDMTFAKKGTYGVPEFAGTEVNRRSGNLKGLTGYLHEHFTNNGRHSWPATASHQDISRRHSWPATASLQHIHHHIHIHIEGEGGTTSGREGRLGSEIGVVEVLLVVLQ